MAYLIPNCSKPQALPAIKHENYEFRKISNILGAETVKKIYDDGLSKPVQESGKSLTDLIKVARLFTAPIQLLACYQDRLEKYLNKVREGVPVEQQIEAPAFISGPIMERLKYLEEDNYLTNLYISLLQKAIDKERINEAHPTFYHIIDQLSPDEAMILYIISQKPIEYEYTSDLIIDEKGKSRFVNRQVTVDTTPKEKIVFNNHFGMYISHLESLNLVSWPVFSQEAIWENENDSNLRKQTGSYSKTVIHLTEFGQLFVKACIPKYEISIK